MSDKKVKVFFMGLDDRDRPIKGHILEIEHSASSIRKYVGYAPISISIPNTNIHVFINISSLDFDSHPNAAFYMLNDIHAIFRGNILFCRCDIDLYASERARRHFIDVITDITEDDIDYILSHFKRAYEEDGHLCFVDDNTLGGIDV